MNKKFYRVKVVERHVDIIWVEAKSEEEAKDIAHSDAKCEFECVEECVVLEQCEEMKINSKANW